MSKAAAKGGGKRVFRRVHNGKLICGRRQAPHMAGQVGRQARRGGGDGMLRIPAGGWVGWGVGDNTGALCVAVGVSCDLKQ